jgi:uncharacterized protein YabE (DUF348 family)
VKRGVFDSIRNQKIDMKKLKKVKKQWVAVSVGTVALALGTGSQLVSAQEASTNAGADLQAPSSNIETNSNLSETTVKQATTEGENQTGTEQTSATTPAPPSLSLSDVMAATTPAEDVLPSSTSVSTQPISDLSAHDQADEAALKSLATPVIGAGNESSQLPVVTTEDNRTVVSQPTVDRDYQVHYDAENKWYYIDAVDFGLDVTDSVDDITAVNKALQVANDVVMADESGQQYRGVAVKLSGIVNVARDQATVDHYELRTFGDGIAYTVTKGSLAGVANTAHITAEEYAALTIPSDGLVSYIGGDGEQRKGTLLPIYKQNGAFNQIKIDSSLSNVTALFGDGAGTTDIRTNLVQLGTPWNSDDNDTDSRDHAVVLVEGLDGFVIKDLSVTIKNLTDAFGMKEDGFYVKGMPYYGKVNGIQIDDSDRVLVDGVEVSGANKAGVHLGSSYNSVSSIQLDPNTWNGKNFGTHKLRSLNYLVANKAQGYQFEDLNIGEYNEVRNSNLHHNRVAGVQFAYQKHFLLEGSTLAKNGHELNGSTGYGAASSAGSFNDYVVFRDNFSSYNYRKGLDIHDGNHVLIENNISYGDRLLGVSVYNRTYPMENVIIRNNVITQDKNNRLFKNDLAPDGRFEVGSDYIQYEAIHLQTNEKFRDLSRDGNLGYFEISNNTIQGLNATGKFSTGESYISNAVLVRMQEPYLDYVLKISNNTITGESASNIFKIINRSVDNLNNSNAQTETTAFATGLGRGSGAIEISGNKAKVTTVAGEPDRSLSPIHIADDVANTLIQDTTKAIAYQDKFRGSLVIEDNDFRFENTNVSGRGNTVSPVNIISNAEGIIVKDNYFDFGQVNQSYTRNSAMQKPLIQMSGLPGPTVTPAVNGIALNTSATPSNLPGTLRHTQPLVFLNNDIVISSISYNPQAVALPIKVLSSDSLLRYFDNNSFTSRSDILAPIPVDGRVDANGNTFFSTTSETVKPDQVFNSRQYNLGVTRFETNAPHLLTTSTETILRPTVFVTDSNLPAGQILIEQEGQDGSKEVKTYAIGVDNTVYEQTGGIDVLNPYPNLKRSFFSLKNVEEATSNNRIPGLLHGDYITTTDQPLVANKTYNYATTVKAADGTLLRSSTEVNYSYADMPIGLANATDYVYTEESILTPALDRIVRIGVNTTSSTAVVETKSIPFETVYRQTDQLLVGMHQILVNGVDGEQTLIYRQIRDADDGSLIGDKVLVSEFETLKPITQIVLVGTKPLTVTTERVEVVAVDYAVERIETDQLLVGESRLERAGQKGERTLVYRDTLDNRTGLTSTVLVSDTETLAPVSERLLVGTKKALTDQPIVEKKPSVSDTVPSQQVMEVGQGEAPLPIQEQAEPATGKTQLPTTGEHRPWIQNLLGLAALGWGVFLFKKKHDEEEASDR